MQKESDAEIISAYKSCFNSAAGKIVLKHLIRVHAVFRSSFSEDSTHAMAFNEGGKNSVLQILRKLHKKDEELEDQLTEQGEEYDNESIF